MTGLFFGIGLDNFYLANYVAERFKGGFEAPLYVEATRWSEVSDLFLGVRIKGVVGYVSFGSSWIPSPHRKGATVISRSLRLLVGRPLGSFRFFTGVSLEKPSFIVGMDALKEYNRDLRKGTYWGLRSEVSYPVIWKMLYLSPRIGLVYFPVARWYSVRFEDFHDPTSYEVFLAETRKNPFRMYAKVFVGLGVLR